jgi:putative spermidine/putrescine transport system ATP-binding protein
MTELALNGVSRAFGSVRAADGVSFVAKSGELISVLGPSGCGKSTVLNLIAGFVRPDDGVISLDGRVINEVPPSERKIGIVFQSYALFPHLTAFENVAFGLRMRGAAKADIARDVGRALDMVRMASFGTRYPRQLSGGEQQRIALARALVINPTILLLDEPLAALDKQIRQSMQMELLAVQRAAGVTALFVTHDQEEAMALSNRIVVMRAGKVEQIGTPSEIYHRPANRFVAGFIGRANFLDAVVVTAGDDVIEARLANGFVVRAHARGLGVNDKVALAIRPESISVLLNGSAADASALTGTLDLGPVSQVHVDVAGIGRIEVAVAGAPGARGAAVAAPGTITGLGWSPENVTVLKS